MGIGVRIQQQEVIARHTAQNHPLQTVEIVESIAGRFMDCGQERFARIFAEQSQQLPQGKNHYLAAFLLQRRHIECRLRRGFDDRLFFRVRIAALDPRPARWPMGGQGDPLLQWCHREENFGRLARINRELIGKAEALDSPQEGKQAVKMTRLSCHRFRSNEVRLWLFVMAYNLGNLWRRLVLPRKIENWSLTSVQQRLVKTGGRLVKHARYYWLMLAESHLTRRLFGAMVGRIAALPVATG
jgi:hypothetical protein